jgi:hypothetical protein
MKYLAVSQNPKAQRSGGRQAPPVPGSLRAKCPERKIYLANNHTFSRVWI